MTTRTERWLIHSVFWGALLLLIALATPYLRQRLSVAMTTGETLLTLAAVGLFLMSLAGLVGVFWYLNVQVDARALAEQTMAEQRQRIEAMAQRQSALAELELAIHQPMELTRLLERVTILARDLLPAAATTVVVWESNREPVAFSARRADSRVVPPGLSALGPEAAPNRWLREHHRVLVVPDRDQQPSEIASWLREAGLRACVAIPLEQDGVVRGALYAWSAVPREYDAQALEFLQALAVRCALVIERVRLYEELQQWNRQLEQRVAERTEALAEANRQLQDLSLRLLQSQDEERRRLARELHDVTAQNLTAASLNLAQIHPTTERERERLAECAALVEQSLREIRTLSYVLHPPVLDEHGLARAVEWFVEGFQKRTGIVVRCEAVGELPRLARPVELALFRVVQEALSNVHRHAGNATVCVTLATDRDAVRVEVADTGRGFPSTRTEAGGVGLASMRERMRQIGGKLQVDSSPTGTRVVAVVPIGREETASA
ncbi:MAG: GAF domain-containing sensor histidine kinase [Verrucomicrobiae bacterium]|nr:GAF domain-containing sensor histidine kinase [Verrucomicrobiae bacterium]